LEILVERLQKAAQRLRKSFHSMQKTPQHMQATLQPLKKCFEHLCKRTFRFAHSGFGIKQAFGEGILPPEFCRIVVNFKKSIPYKFMT
jgi:hypothetical protein